MSNEKKKTSPWFYVGIGCLVAFIILICVIIGIGFVGYRWARQTAEDIKDPIAREAKVKGILGAETLPSGYYPLVGFSIPLVMDMAILGDREGATPEGRPFEERGFIFMNTIGSAAKQNGLRDYFEGKTTDLEALRRQSIRMREGDLIRRGELKATSPHILYVARRGAIEWQNREVEGVTAMLLIVCEGDTRTRLGILFGPDPDPSTDVKKANFKGSPADEDELRSFAGHFNFCKKQ